MKPTSWIVLIVLPFFGLAGCSYEERELTTYEAGVYQGEKDPLLAKNLSGQLKDRIRQVQTDR